MAIKTQGIEFQVGADTGEAVSNLQKFEREFKSMLEQMGKSTKEIAAFEILAKEIERGTKSTDELDSETRQLLDTYRILKRQAQDRDFLGLQSHQDVRNQIEAVKQAYERLKASGKLTSKELAQAAQVMQWRIRDLERSTNGWLDALSSAKAELAAMAGSAAALGGVIAQAIEFEDAMAGVRKVVDGTDGQFRRLEGTLKDMATAGTLGASELARIAAVGGQLGVPIAKLGQFTGLAQKMAAAFDLGAEQAAQAIAKLANVFNLPIDNVEALSDAINVLGNNTAATEAQILDALTRIGGTATQFGLAADQAAALADAFIALGRPPEVAATAINALLTRLQTANVQSKAFQEGLSQLGIAAEDLAAGIREKPQQALLEFLGTLQDLDQQSRAEILTRLFGQEHADEIAALVGSLDQYRKALGLVADQSKTAGATTREFEARMQTTQAQFDRLANAAEVAAINLGRTLLPAVTPAIEAFGDMTAAAADLVERFPELARLATVMSTVAVSVGGLKAAFTALKIAQAGAFESMAGQLAQLRQPIPEVVSGIGKLATAFNVLGAAITGWEIGTALRNEFESVRQAGVYLIEGLVKGFEYLRTAWESVKAVFSDDTIEQVLARHAKRVEENARIFADMHEQAKKAGDAIQETGDKADQAADKQNRLTDATNRNKDALGGLGDAADDAKNQLDDLRDGADTVSQALDKLGIDVTRTAIGISQSFIELTAAFDTLAQSGETSTEVLAAAAGKLFDQARSAEELTAALTRLERAQQGQTLTAEAQVAQYAKILQKLNALSEEEQKRIASQSKLAKSALDYAKSQQASIEADIRAARTKDQLAAIENRALELRQKGVLTESQLADIRARLAEETERLAAAQENQASSQQLLNEQVDQAAETTDRLKNSTNEAADASKDFANAMGGLVDAINGFVMDMGPAATARFEQLAGANLGLAKRMRDSGDALAAMQSELRQVNDIMRANRNIVGNLSGSLGKYNEAAYRTRLEFLQQGIAAEELARRIRDTDNVTREMVQSAKATLNQFNLLDEARLENLKSAIADAESQLDRLSDKANRAKEALGGLAGTLKDELDRLDNNREAIEQRRFQRQLERIAELERAGGEAARREAEQARRLAEQLHQRKLDQIRREQDALRGRDRGGRSDRGGAQREDRARTRVEKVIKVDFGKGSLNIPASQERDFLAMLEQFKRVSS